MVGHRRTRNQINRPARQRNQAVLACAELGKKKAQKDGGSRPEIAKGEANLIGSGSGGGGRVGTVVVMQLGLGEFYASEQASHG